MFQNEIIADIFSRLHVHIPFETSVVSIDRVKQQAMANWRTHTLGRKAIPKNVLVTTVSNRNDLGELFSPELMKDGFFDSSQDLTVNIRTQVDRRAHCK